MIPVMSEINIVALAGGVGGAKFADGLAQALPAECLTVIVNTGDDFSHLGFWISPDLDTVCYTLAGIENPDSGWGRRNETWNVFSQLKQMEMPDWFQLGDLDIATHIVRTSRQKNNWTLNQITQELCRVWGIKVKILPMSNQVVQTQVHTIDGVLEFQEYFAHQKCMPAVKGFTFKGSNDSLPAPGVLEALEKANAVVICPSNPYVSIDPILSVPGIKTALNDHLVVAVSPIIGSHAIKGPAAKMFSDLGIDPSAFAVAQHYGSIIDGLIIDRSDSSQATSINALGICTYQTDIIMQDRIDRKRLALEVLEFINSCEQVK
jgi:LPPG:FO 2-phospho-L-lactate transferase